MTPLASAHAAVTVVDVAQKVLPGEQPAGAAAATLRAARNEFEPFQLVISGGEGGRAAVSATASALAGPAGVIPASEIRLYRVGYLDLATPSNIEGGTGRWPDPLIPDVDEVANQKRNAFPFAIPPGENRVILADVFVPKGTAPGVYTGSITIHGLAQPVSVPITLNVLDFELPSTSSLPTTYGMVWNGACVAHHGSYDACGQDAGLLATNTMYARFMLDHRISGEVVYTGPKASASGGYDWAGSFDRHYGPLLDGEAGTRLTGARLTSFRYRWTETTERYAAWAEHLGERGWLSRSYHYLCDEPPMTCAWSDIPARAAKVRAGAPALSTLVTTNIDEAVEHGVDDDIDILVPVVNHLHGRPGSSRAGDQRAKYDAFLQSGPRKALWWYQSCMSHGCATVGGASQSGWPSFMIDASGVQNRAMQWLTFLYRVSGELYFETLYRLPDAWTSVYAFGGNGDGTLLYPGMPARIGGTAHVPVASLRLKLIREGMEDYEYLKKLSDLGEDEFARQVARGLFPTPYQTRQPAAKLREARDLLIDRLVERTATAPVPGTPPEVPSGSPDDQPSRSDEPGGWVSDRLSPETAPPRAPAAVGCSQMPGGPGNALLVALALAGALRRRR